MRLIISTLILLILFVSCTSKSEENEFLKNYQYPFDSLTKPKVFVYQRLDSTKQKAYIYQHYFSKNGAHYFLKYGLGQNLCDSSIFEIVDEYPILKECYKIVPDRETNIAKVNQGKIIEWFNTDYKHNSKIEYSDAFGKDIITDLVNSSVYDTTLVFEFNGEKIDCIRYKDSFKFNTKHKYFSNINSTFEIKGESIYGKGLGIIYYTTKNMRNGETSQWQLDKIIEYQDYIKEKTRAARRDNA